MPNKAVVVLLLSKAVVVLLSQLGYVLHYSGCWLAYVVSLLLSGQVWSPLNHIGSSLSTSFKLSFGVELGLGHRLGLVLGH